VAASTQSSDGTTTVSASFGTAAAYLSASGGGRVGSIHYYYTFSGNFSGTEVINGVSGAIRGETSESMDSVTTASGSAPACCGSAGVNSAYTPVYISDYSFSRLVRADDLWGTNQQIRGSAESLIFSTEPVGLKSSAQSVTLANSGAGSVSITGIAFKGDFLGGGTCGTSLGAGQSCVENVRFKPTAAGVRTGALTFTLPSRAITVSLAGTAAATATSVLTVKPTALPFDGYTVGDNPDQIVTISNPDGVPAGIKSITKTGSAAFTYPSTCGTVLAAGASWTLDVTFMPTALGSFSGMLSIYESAGIIHAIPLTGTAVTSHTREPIDGGRPSIRSRGASRRTFTDTG